MKRLVAVEFEVKGDEKQLAVGEKYSYFQDPETGKYYRPAPGFGIEHIEDLGSGFIEVPTE